MRPSKNLDNRPCKVLISKGILGGRGRKERFNQKGLKVCLVKIYGPGISRKERFNQKGLKGLAVLHSKAPVGRKERFNQKGLKDDFQGYFLRSTVGKRGLTRRG